MTTKTPVRKASALIDQLHILEDEQLDLFLDQLINSKSQNILGFLNQHAYNLAAENPKVLESFSNIDYLLRDGIGIKFACQWNKTSPGANLNGTDFIPALIAKAHASDVDVDYFVFGTESPWLEEGTHKLMGGRDCHTLHGFHHPDEYVEYARNNARPEALTIVVLAMGMPKQEHLAWRLRESAVGSILVVCGGAIIDFQAERFERAPPVMRRYNLEWLFRLAREPQRLFARYVLGIPKFLYYLVVNK
ncbi:WecB/TagA/CpsF family glycosyltransferase [Xanthomonas sp. WHRI 1810A]|uniref:WecB/TagA/CpsF family glycosyltransferase n=1 Tax=Xanthomonas sp. WHRI 1810A TaxID=3161565 RepID=UPI0032E88B01